MSRSEEGVASAKNASVVTVQPLLLEPLGTESLGVAGLRLYFEKAVHRQFVFAQRPTHPRHDLDGICRPWTNKPVLSLAERRQLKCRELYRDP